MLDQTAKVFRDEGLPIYAMTQAKPFEMRYTLDDAQCFDEFPTWKAAMFSPVEARKRMFADPDCRRKFRTEAIEDQSPSVFPRRWDVIYVDRAKLEKNKELERKTVAEIARAKGKDGLDVFLDLALEEDLETRFVHITTQGDPDAVCEILKHPSIMIGQSDAGAHMGYDARFGYCTAFLGRWVRDHGIMPLEAAVSKLTFQVASVFGLHDRPPPSRHGRRSGHLRSGDGQHARTGVRPGPTGERNKNDSKSSRRAPHGGQRRSRHRRRRCNGCVSRPDSPAAGVAELTRQPVCSRRCNGSSRSDRSVIG
jgi:N-acyl-D-aspartate/D-glutamate deacylase